MSLRVTVVLLSLAAVGSVFAAEPTPTADPGLQMDARLVRALHEMLVQEARAATAEADLLLARQRIGELEQRLHESQPSPSPTQQLPGVGPSERK